MNRYNSEYRKKFEELKSLVEKQDTSSVEGALALLESVQEAAVARHVREFPEEYDFILDDRVDAKRRSAGINPMSPEYQERVRNRRDDLGVSQLNSSGLSDGSTYSVIYEDLLATALRQSEEPEAYTRIINIWRELQ